jgi:hypothetical protein
MMSSITKTGALGGTLLSVFASLHLEDLVKTTVLAIVGVTVSVCVSFLLKYLQQKFFP